MRIGMIAPPWFPLPPRRYGGIELVVSMLTEGLVRRGHEVTLFASGDSVTRAHLSYIFARAPFEQIADGSVEVVHSLDAYARAREFDLIHDHDGLASGAMGHWCIASWGRRCWPLCTARPTRRRRSS